LQDFLGLSLYHLRILDHDGVRHFDRIDQAARDAVIERIEIPSVPFRSADGFEKAS